MRAVPKRLAIVIPVALATIAAGVAIIAVSAHGAGPACRSAGSVRAVACATVGAVATSAAAVADSAAPSAPASVAPSATPSPSAASPSARASGSPKPVATAPAGTFAVGRRGNYTFTRAGRTLITRIWYPAGTGKAGAVTADAPIAAGRYPLILF